MNICIYRYSRSTRKVQFLLYNYLQLNVFNSKNDISNQCIIGVIYRGTHLICDPPRNTPPSRDHEFRQGNHRYTGIYIITHLQKAVKHINKFISMYILSHTPIHTTSTYKTPRHSYAHMYIYNFHAQHTQTHSRTHVHT